MERKKSERATGLLYRVFRRAADLLRPGARGPDLPTAVADLLLAGVTVEGELMRAVSWHPEIRGCPDRWGRFPEVVAVVQPWVHSGLVRVLSVDLAVDSSPLEFLVLDPLALRREVLVGVYARGPRPRG